MARTADTGSTDSTVVGGRVTVSLPKEAAADLARLKAHFESEIEKATNVAVELTHAQVIQTALKKLGEFADQVKADAEKVAGDSKPAAL